MREAFVSPFCDNAKIEVKLSTTYVSKDTLHISTINSTEESKKETVILHRKSATGSKLESISVRATAFSSDGYFARKLAQIEGTLSADQLGHQLIQSVHVPLCARDCKVLRNL